MNWLADLIPKDKLLHMVAGLIIWSFISIYDKDIAFSLVVVVGILKEVYDEYKYKGGDIEDLLTTIALPTMLYLIELVIKY